MGSTAPVKERRVLNDPKRVRRANFDHIPVSIIFDVIIRTALFVLWAMGPMGNGRARLSYCSKISDF